MVLGKASPDNGTWKKGGPKPKSAFAYYGHDKK